MALVMEMFRSLGEIGNDLKTKNKDTSVVKLLDKTINTLDLVMKAIDRFLKKKGIDVGKTVNDGKSRGKSLLEKLKTNKSGEKVGITKGLIDKGNRVKAIIKDQYAKFTESNTAPPDSEKIGLTEKVKSYFKKKEPTDAESTTTPKPSFYESMTDKLSLIAERLAPKDDNDLDKDGIKEVDWAEKADNRSSKRKAEIEEEKKAAKLSKKKKGKKDNLLSNIFSKIGSLGSLLSTAIWGASKFLGKGVARAAWWGIKKMGSGLATAARFLSTKLLSGMSGLFTKLIPNISGGLAKSLQSLIGKGLKNGAKLALSGAMKFGRAALPYAGRALGVVAKGVGLVVSGPVGWAIAIGTVGYELYNLYKYLTRNDIAEDVYGKLHLLRLQTYGFGHNAKEYYSKIFELEGLMKENLSFNAQEKKLSISELTEEQTEKIYDLFGVESDSKEQKAIVGNWFSSRFIPAYHAFVQTLYGINTSIYIDSLEKLNPKNIQQFLMIYKPPGVIYSYSQIPYFEQPDTTVTKKDVDTTLESIKFETNSKLKAADKSPMDRITGEVAKQKVSEKTEAITRSSLQKAGIKVSVKSSQNDANKPVGIMPISPDGEAPPLSGSSLLTATAVNMSKSIPKATGPVMPFDGTLAGIRTKLKREAIMSLDPDVLNLFAGMAKEYQNLTGKEITVNEGFRSYAEQAALYSKYGASGRAAPPGRSLHEFGLAIDINSENTRELEKLGLLRKYGFTVPIGAEEWHIEPIGVSLDPNKSKHDKGFRKAAIESSVGRGGGGYGFVKNSKKYGRDIALQRSIFESKITETKPEEVGTKEGASLLMANPTPAAGAPASTATVQTSSVTAPVAEAAAAKTAETTTGVPTSSNTVGGAVSLSALMGGSIVSQEPEPTVKTSTSAPSAVESGYGSSVGTTNPNMNVSKYGTLTPVQAIKQASKMTGVPEDTLLTFGKLESSLKANASAGTSSAGGLFQFTDSTWSEQLSKHGSKYGLTPLTSKTDPLANALMAAEYAKSNLSSVSGFEETGMSKDTALYLTHHFGAFGGKKLINAYKKTPEAPVTTAVSTKAYESNKASLAGKTVSGYVASVEQKFEVARSTPTSAYKGSGGTAVASTGSSEPSIASGSTFGAPYAENDATTARVSYSPTSVAAPAPTITQSAYDINKVDSPISSAKTEQAPSVTVNTDNLELIMNNQLTTLTQIATVLGTISDKLDVEKLAGILSGLSSAPSSPQQPTPSVKQVPHTGVNMGKRIMT